MFIEENLETSSSLSSLSWTSTSTEESFGDGRRALNLPSDHSMNKGANTLIEEKIRNEPNGQTEEMRGLLNLVKKGDQVAGEECFATQNQFQREEFTRHDRKIEDQRKNRQWNDDQGDISMALAMFEALINRRSVRSGQFEGFLRRTKIENDPKEKKNEPREINENIGQFSEDMIDVFDLRDDQRRVHIDRAITNVRSVGIRNQFDRGRTENTANDQKGKDEDHRETTTDLAEHCFVLTMEILQPMN